MGEEATSEATPDPVSAVRRRVALFHRDKDPRHLDGRRAEAEYAAAMRTAMRLDRAGEPEYNLAVLAELARFRFWRGAVSGTVSGQVEADSAVGFLLGLRETLPDLIPGEMADVVGELATDARRRLSWAVDSAGRLLGLFDGTDLAPVDQAIERVSWALRTAPSDPAARVAALGRLGHAYHERHRATGDVADERKAVSARREAVLLTPPGRDRARRQSLLADALMTVYDRTNERACLEEALRCLEDSVAGTPPGDEFLWLRYSRLGRAYRHRAGLTRSPADSDAAVRWGRLARDTIDASDPDWASALRTLDRNLRARHARTRDRADLDEAVGLWRSALGRMPSDDARRAGFLVDLSDALCHRFDHGGDPADLEGSVQACEAAVAEATEGSRSRVRALSDLCHRLHRRFQHGDDLADLRRAVHTGRQAVALTSPEDGEDGVVTFANLLHATVAWYDRAGDLARLDEAIALWADILAATPADHADRGERLAGSIHVLARRFEHTGDRADLDRVFAAARECLTFARSLGQVAETLLRVTHHLDVRAASTARSADVGLELDNARLSTRSRSTADLDAVDTLVDLARSMVASTVDDADDREACQGFLAIALAARYGIAGRAEDGAESIRMMHGTVVAADPDDPRLSVHLSNLGNVLVGRFLREGDPTDLDTAVETFARAFRAVPPADRDRAEYLPKLAHALRLRYEDRRDPGDLERVVAVVRDAVASGLPSPDCRPATLVELTRTLVWRFHHTRDTADLDAAAAAGREAVRLAAANATPPANAPSLLASALFTRYQQTANPVDLDEAISILGTALADITDERKRLSNLHDHAVYVQARALLTGSSADFDRSVAELREVTNARSADDPAHWLDFYSLGMALRVRHARLHDDLDLHAAVEAHRTALRKVSRDSLERAIAAVGLAHVLGQVHERTGDRALLDQAITLAAEAEPEFPEHGGIVSQPLSVLSWLYTMRIDLPGEPDPADVAEMLRISKRMIDTARPGSADHSLFLRNRAVAQITAARFQRDGSLLDQALATARQAVESTRAGDTRRSEWLWSLGLIHLQRHRTTGQDADRAAALVCWREAARDPYGHPDMVTRCAVHAGRLAARQGDADGAVADYGVAVGHLPTIAWHGMRTDVRSDSLRGWSGLASEAAGAAIAAGRPATAVEMLEQSRSVIWSQTLRLRSDPGDLARSHPALAERLTELRARLDAFSSLSRLDESSPLGEPHHLPARAVGIQEPVSPAEADERRRELAREWDETVEGIRRLEGFEHFLGPTPYAELKQAAADGPVVVVNVSAYGGHALIVRDDEPEPEVVVLRGVSPGNVSDRASELLSALRVQTDLRASFLARERARHLTHDVLGWVWDHIVGPILARLRHADRSRCDHPASAPPRVWWCPVGPLSLLPLHAAGHHPRHGSATASDSMWTADLVVSSYTPTLAALTRSRAPRSSPTVARHLAVALQETPGLAGLPAVADELAGLLRHSTGRTEVVSLAGPEATRQAVLAELPRCDRVHFACHAAQDFVDPAASAFSLHDGPLSVADIAAVELDGAELAFLSACQTATHVPDLADEAIHLAAAVQLTGFRHIVATSWSVDDTSAAALSDHFYRELASSDGGPEPAMALHRAVRALRDSDPTAPVKWASYVHFGS
ncbi:CHAT domain-containing protein [Streptomyces sp. NPDC058847]|uniref:CHAT domain-containing protein n=1 Tax=Streptomyces sp. NPDC058847 TaxID=3346649 RepID=UPI0036A0D40B